MSENNGATNLGFFMAGLGIGAILALLFAPRSGKETRDFLSQKADEGREYVRGKSKEFRAQAGEYVDKAKDIAAKQKEQLSAALEAGRQAYQEERKR